MLLRSRKRTLKHQDDESEIVDVKKSRSNGLPKIKAEKLSPRALNHYNYGNTDTDDSEAEENSKENASRTSKQIKRPWSTKRLKWYDEEFNVRVCDDVLTDVFSHGMRIELAKLETEAVRFERLIQSRFSLAPFLVFDMKCAPVYKDDVLLDSSVSMKNIYAVSITQPIKRPRNRILFAFDAVFPVPSFIRFRKVLIEYCQYQQKSFRKWFKARSLILSQFKPAFVGCVVTFKFRHFINSNQSESGNFSQINGSKIFLNVKVAFIHQIISEYFAQCGRYKYDSIINIYQNIKHHLPCEEINIASLLMPWPVQRCALVKIKHHIQRTTANGSTWFRWYKDSVQTLPIEAILNWLDRPLGQFGQNCLDMGERHLSILMDSIQNLGEMIYKLKQDFQTSGTRGQPFLFTIKIKKKKMKLISEELSNKKTSELLSIKTTIIKRKKGGRIALITIKRTKI